LASQNYILLSTLWIAYCVVHSALISGTVTEFFKRSLGNKYRFYRLFFNTFSAATLVPLLIYSGSGNWKSPILFVWEGFFRPVQYTMIFLGTILLLSAARHYSMLRFLGFKQIGQEKSGKGLIGSGGLDTSGVLGLIRHPWYSGVFLLVWAHDISLSELIINLILSAYLVIGAFLEERKLIVEFGDRYREYQRQVSMFFPMKWLKAKLPILVRMVYPPAEASPPRPR